MSESFPSEDISICMLESLTKLNVILLYVYICELEKPIVIPTPKWGALEREDYCARGNSKSTYNKLSIIYVPFTDKITHQTERFHPYSVNHPLWL